MSLIFIGFWIGVFIFCGYVFLEISNSTTSTDRIKQLRYEMERLDQMENIQDRMNRTNEQANREWEKTKQQWYDMYNNVNTFILEIRQTIIQIIIDTINPRLYRLVG
jgi:hypothetical protein